MRFISAAPAWKSAGLFVPSITRLFTSGSEIGVKTLWRGSGDETLPRLLGRHARDRVRSPSARLGKGQAMTCDWNADLRDEPDKKTGKITCRCHNCGRYADLVGWRDFRSGRLVVSAVACQEKGGLLLTRETR